MSKVAVVIPNHKDELDDLEKISLAQARKVLKRYPLIHAVPEGKIFSYFAAGESVVHFPTEYFQTLRGYNNLSISTLFYEPFLDLDYILIYQTDAFVFYDALEDFVRSATTTSVRRGRDMFGKARDTRKYLGLATAAFVCAKSRRVTNF